MTGSSMISLLKVLGVGCDELLSCSLIVCGICGKVFVFVIVYGEAPIFELIVVTLCVVDTET